MPQFTLYNFKTLGNLSIPRSGYSWGIKNTRRYCFQPILLSIYFMVRILLHKCTNENISEYIYMIFLNFNELQCHQHLKVLTYERSVDNCCPFCHQNVEKSIKNRKGAELIWVEGFVDVPNAYKISTMKLSFFYMPL